MPTEIFTYAGVRIRVQAEHHDDIEWLREFLTPWFDTGFDTADVTVRVMVDAEYYSQLYSRGDGGGHVDAFMMDTKIIQYPLWRVPGERSTFLDITRSVFFQLHSEGVDLICRDRGPESRLLIMRVVREYAMSAAQETGGRFLHASSISMSGRAMLITGPRSAGKTSLLTYLLSYLPAHFLANDRVWVDRRNGNVRLRGMPTVVSIRDGTLGLFPDLQRSLRASRFNSRLNLAECGRVDGIDIGGRRPGKKGVSPAQFCALMECEPVRDAFAAAIVFPRQTGQPGGMVLRALDKSDTRSYLCQGLFGHIGPGSLSEVFTLDGRSYGVATASNDGELLDMLSADVPGYVCEMGTDAYADSEGAYHLQQLLRPEGSRAGPIVKCNESCDG